MKKKNNKSIEKMIKSILSWLKYVFLVTGILYVFLTFVGGKGTVDGRSMEPTLNSEDVLFLDKFSSKIQGLKRFDVIVFPYQHEYNTEFIKRVIGLPGETVQIFDGEVYIDGEKLQDAYAGERMEDSGIASKLIQLGKDEYFVLGDNRNNSMDSRDDRVGVISKSQIVGKAWFCIWPLEDIKFLYGYHLPVYILIGLLTFLIVVCAYILHRTPQESTSKEAVIKDSNSGEKEPVHEGKGQHDLNKATLMVEAYLLSINEKLREVEKTDSEAEDSGTRVEDVPSKAEDMDILAKEAPAEAKEAGAVSGEAAKNEPPEYAGVEPEMIQCLQFAQSEEQKEKYKLAARTYKICMNHTKNKRFHVLAKSGYQRCQNRE